MVKTGLALRGFGIVAVAASVGLWFSAGEVRADAVYDFMRISAADEAPVNTADNYRLTVSDLVDDRVRFRIDNLDLTPGVTNAAIGRVFFQDRQALFLTDGELIDFDPAAHIDASPGVSYSGPSYGETAGGNLPRGQNVGFTTHYWFEAQPQRPSGANLGEWVHFDLKLADGRSFQDVLDHIVGDLNIGLHVQAIAIEGYEGEFSDSFVLVPSPAAVGPGLALLGLLGFARPRRR